MPLLYDVPEYQKKRVIIDTDAVCKADDPFAIAHALMSKKFYRQLRNTLRPNGCSNRIV